MSGARIRSLQLKKVFGWWYFSTDFNPKSNWYTMHFWVGLDLKLNCGLKVGGNGGCEIKFIFFKVAQIKNSLRICYSNFKSFSNKSARIFLFEQLLNNKVDFGASNFEAAVLLQIEVKQKMLGRSVTFGPKSVEKRFQQQNFFELTTPIRHSD